MEHRAQLDSVRRVYFARERNAVLIRVHRGKGAMVGFDLGQERRKMEVNVEGVRGSFTYANANSRLCTFNRGK
jgi:hypothetical protein